MGMRAELEQITSNQLKDFLRNPREAYDHLLSESFDNPESAAVMEKMLQELEAKSLNVPPEFRAQIAKVVAQTKAKMEKNSAKPQREKTKPVRKTFSLEKDWHVLHYALNGTTEGGQGPLGDAILGGREIRDVEGVMGYGPMRYLEPRQVRAVAEALTGVDPEQLLSKLDREDAEAKRIYLAHTLDDLGDWSYLPGFFEDFRRFYGDAARNGNALLLSIT